MPHSFGFRARTRKLFKKKHNEKARRPLRVYQHIYRKNDFVDVKIDSSQQKGMPYKIYHGKTGRVHNITKTSLGVLFKKVVGNREILKMVNMRVEHLRPSKCRKEFLDRKLVEEAKKNGKTIPSAKRQPEGAKEGKLVKIENPEVNIIDVSPLPYVSPY